MTSNGPKLFYEVSAMQIDGDFNQDDISANQMSQ